MRPVKPSPNMRDMILLLIILLFMETYISILLGFFCRVGRYTYLYLYSFSAQQSVQCSVFRSTVVEFMTDASLCVCHVRICVSFSVGQILPIQYEKCTITSVIFVVQVVVDRILILLSPGPLLTSGCVRVQSALFAGRARAKDSLFNESADLFTANV